MEEGAKIFMYDESDLSQLFNKSLITGQGLLAPLKLLQSFLL